MSLTDAKARNAKPREKPYKLADGGGLYLEVMPNGSRYWRWKYRIEGREKRLALGVYPDVALADARAGRDAARKLLAKGVDPGEARKAARAAAEARSEHSFEAVAREFIASRRSRWATSHAEKIIRRMELDVYPYIGARPIAEINAPDLLKVLRRIEERGAHETAHRARSECGQVFRYAIATGRAERDPSGDLRGALKPVDAKHFPAITEAAPLAELLRAIEGYRGDHVTRCALKLAPLLFVRPGELRAAEWSCFDLDSDAPSWRYTVSKTKTGHIVPLATQAVATLSELHPLTGAGRYVFPGARTRARCMSENTVNAALRRLGYPVGAITGHGFRATARSLLAEMGWAESAIERQLAHKPAGPLGAAYDRARFLDERRRMMQAWADYLDRLRQGGNVVAGSFVRVA